MITILSTLFSLLSFRVRSRHGQISKHGRLSGSQMTALCDQIDF
jgi:hypothetical protein